MARSRDDEHSGEERLRRTFDYSSQVLEEIRSSSLDPGFISEAVHFLGRESVRRDPDLRNTIFYAEPIGRHRLLSDLLNVDNPSDSDNFQRLLSHNEVQETIEGLRNGERKPIWPRLCLNNIASLISALAENGPQLLAYESPALTNPAKETLLDRGNEAIEKWKTWNPDLSDAEKIGIAYEINKAKLALEEVGVIFWEFQKALNTIHAFLPDLSDVLQVVENKLAFAYTDDEDEERDRQHYVNTAEWHVIKIPPLKVLNEEWVASNLPITEKPTKRRLFEFLSARQDEAIFSDSILFNVYEIIKNVQIMQHEILHALVSELLDRKNSRRRMDAEHEGQKYPKVSLMKVILEGVSVSFDFEFYNQLAQSHSDSPEIMHFVKQRQKNEMNFMAAQRMEFRKKKGEEELQDNRENAYFLGFSWALAMQKNGWDVTNLSHIIAVFQEACSDVLGQEVTAEMLEYIPADLDPNSIFARCISRTNELLGKRS